MDVQDAAALTTPDGSVRNIHNKNGDLLWSAVGYDVKYRGDTTQQTYSGKNLFNVNATPTTLRYSTATVDGQSITVTTNDSSNTARVDYSLPYEANKTMTLSYDYEVLVNNTTLGFAIVYLRSPTDSATDAILETSFSLTVGNKGHKTVTLQGGTPDTTKRLWLYVKTSPVSGVVSVKFSNIQLEYAGSETFYEPYVGGAPAPNPDYPQDVNVVKGEQTILVSGKNLFLIPETETKNGVTLTKNSDGTFNLSGTATATATFNIKLDAMIESGTYTLSKSGGNFIAVVQDYLNTSWLSQLITLNYNVDSVTTSINPVGNRVSFVIQARNGITYNLQNVKIQLEKNSSATQFEVHQNKIVNVDLRGKNLFDKNGKITENSWLRNDGLLSTSSTDWSVTDYILISPNTSYTISGMASGSGVNPSRCYYDKDKNFISGIKHNGANPFTNTAPANAYYLRDSFMTADINTLQLEVGSATPYVPYYNYELCKIGNYQDYIYKSSGKNLVDAIDSTWQTSNTTLTKTDGIFRMTAASGKIARAALPLTGLIEGETYTISFDALGVSVSSNNLTYLRIREESSGGGWVSDGVGIYVSSGYVRYSTTFVATSVSNPWAWFYLSANASNTNNVDIYVKNIQLEKGSTATPYEPYGTDWYVRKETGKTVLDGDENVTVIGTVISGRNRFFVDGPDDMITNTDTEIKGFLYSDMFVELTNAQSFAGTTQGMLVRANGSKQFVINYYGVTTGSQFKTWLSTNNVTVYYALGTPTNTKITDNTLIGQLNAVHDWLRRYDYYGAVSGNLPIIINRSGII